MDEKYALIMKLVLLFLLLLFVSSCQNKNVQAIYENRSYLTELCRDKTLLRPRGGNLLIFKTRHFNIENEFVIKIDSVENYHLLRDSIMFKDDPLISSLVRGTENYDDAVCSFVKELNYKLSKFSIIAFSTSAWELGEPLALDLQNGERVINIPDMNKIISDRDYRKSLRKIGESWYYIE